ncbi:DNA-binding protein [Mycobacterium sp. CBMA 234]|uniref:helicase-associated domain-containing protein n=1 Tax=Mycolicibacterium sp. CBMA 234 TaxID=1918495 RepID=UPI0012DFC8C7|nr:helicase-associated domain-containing protein [Mycolicibacterium sp. CBMA 234]MUL64384.1 DNA-binding protein [Mycolicibacterium sp. CBMA 234]
MIDESPGVPLGSWLADMSDAQLVQLLITRPDLTQPPPATLSALAARAQSRQSVKAATDDLDFLQLAVLDALLTLQANTIAVPTGALFKLLAGRATKKLVTSALDELRARGLVWGANTVRVVSEASTVLPWYPGQVTLEDPNADGIAEKLAGIDTPQRELLERLADGAPIGRTRDASPETPADRPVPQLLAAGLLRRIDDETVILPRLVAQVLRGQPPGPTTFTPPAPSTPVLAEADIDAAAAGSAIDLLREVELVIETLSATPVPELRSGGLGVRDAKRLTKVTGIDEQRLSLILELCASATLIASGIPDSDDYDDGPYWAPTVAADRFIEASAATRWHLLAVTWLDLPCRPGLVGKRGPDGKPYAALTNALYSSAAPLDRRLLLTTLADLPPGRTMDTAAASAAMLWCRPRWSARLQPEPTDELLTEAHAVGMLGRGAIAGPIRLLLSGASEDEVTAAMAAALPDPIDHFLLQADLTIVVPGPLERDLADQLAVVADIESAGAATVYRISEQSIRRALDTGKTASEIHSLFARHSKTPVPQGLAYLIDDVARRHGQLRVGMASAFIRCEDPSLLAQVLASPVLEQLSLRALAPTVAVSPAPIADVLAGLRTAGFAPAAEDWSGTIVDLRPLGARVSTPLHRRTFRHPQSSNPKTIGAIVAVLRQTGRGGPGERLDPAAAISLLTDAALTQSAVVIGYVDAAGVATQRVVSPVNVRGGQLTAYDTAAGRVREFAIHRVTSVVSADAGEFP